MDTVSSSSGFTSCTSAMSTPLKYKCWITRCLTASSINKGTRKGSTKLENFHVSRWKKLRKMVVLSGGTWHSPKGCCLTCSVNLRRLSNRSSHSGQRWPVLNRCTRWMCWNMVLRRLKVTEQNWHRIRQLPSWSRRSPRVAKTASHLVQGYIVSLHSSSQSWSLRSWGMRSTYSKAIGKKNEKWIKLIA